MSYRNAFLTVVLLLAGFCAGRLTREPTARAQYLPIPNSTVAPPGLQEVYTNYHYTSSEDGKVLFVWDIRREEPRYLGHVDAKVPAAPVNAPQRRR